MARFRWISVLICFFYCIHNINDNTAFLENQVMGTMCTMCKRNYITITFDYSHTLCRISFTVRMIWISNYIQCFLQSILALSKECEWVIASHDFMWVQSLIQTRSLMLSDTIDQNYDYLQFLTPKHFSDDKSLMVSEPGLWRFVYIWNRTTFVSDPGKYLEYK